MIGPAARGIREALRVRVIHDDATVGAVRAIREQLLCRVAEARTEGVDLVILPELATIGYPPRDLLDLRAIVEADRDTLAALTAAARGVAILVGHLAPNPAPTGKPLFNAASLLAEGAVQATWHKALLPTYDVFDETRYFEPGDLGPVVDLGGWRLGVIVCEDLWTEPDRHGRRLYERDPGRELAHAGADLIVNVSASPYEVDKLALRRRLVEGLVADSGATVIYANQLGANDSLVFDGGSFAVHGGGTLFAQAPMFSGAPLDLVLPAGDAKDPEPVPPPEEGDRAALAALELGLRDYARKCGFRSVVVGLSGGIDSALTAAIAARALGPDRVVGLLMPSPHSSDHSVIDARDLAERLGLEHHVVPIGDLMEAYDRALAPIFGDADPDVTEENIQARIRGNLLMALSNKQGHLLLTTGNKSELAVGYCTLYGDMAGGLALLSDVPKTMVYRLAHLVNEEREVIPQSTIHKPPSAELRPDQRDSDSLPDYDVLDDILVAYIEELADEEAILARGHDPATVRRVLQMIHRTEYKRRQAPLGIKITSRAFGTGRRFPIAHERPT